MYRKDCCTPLACLAVAVVVALAFADPALAQDPLPLPVSSSQVRIAVDSGVVQNDGEVLAVVYSTTVTVPGAEWLRLNFDQVLLAGELMDGTESYLLLTSLADEAFQVMNALHIAQWRDTSAYFNGDAVLLEIFAQPGSGPNRVVMTEVTAGQLPMGDRSICGPTDDRVLSDDARMGRALPVGCTAWMINDCGHCFLTAGHCAYALEVIEFNVPLSNPDGGLNHPPPSDQYAVDLASLQDNGGQGVGDDWAYFGCFENSVTGLTPFEAQGQAFDLATPPPVSGQSIRITGYGSVTPPVPLTWYLVQKTHAGPYAWFGGTTVEYQTDTTGGNSGSPALDESTGFAIAIHTHGGCNTSGANVGTGINHPELQAALAAPQGVCIATVIEFTCPSGLPSVISPAGGTTVRVEVAAGGGVAPQPGTGQFHYDAGGGVVTVAMQQGENGIRYYGPGGCNPPALGFLAIAAYSIDVSVDDPFEADSGWTVGAPDDTATTGIWGRMDPVGTAAQPENDHTAAPGTDCWVTDGRGGGLGDYDVDGGKTTLFSPVYDLSGMLAARASYWRWYSNDTGGAPNADVFVIDISNDGGANWANVETVGPAGPGTSGGWIHYEFVISTVVTPTDQVQFRFVAADEDVGSLVEAALDDFRIVVVNCDLPDCIGDLDGDDDIDLTDLGGLLASYPTADGAAYEDGDLDGDGDVDLTDLAALLAVYGTTCP